MSYKSYGTKQEVIDLLERQLAEYRKDFKENGKRTNLYHESIGAIRCLLWVIPMIKNWQIETKEREVEK